MSQGQRPHQWQTEGEDEVVAEKTQRAATEASRRVQLTIEVDAVWKRRTHRLANLGNKRKQQRFGGGAQGERLGPARALCEKRFDHEDHEHQSRKQRRAVNQQLEQEYPGPATERSQKEVEVRGPKIDRPSGRRNQTHVKHRQQDHRHRDEQEPDPVKK